MTYEVQQTRWDRMIRRVSGSIGPGSRVSETISELFPVLDVERAPGELLVLAGTHICHGAAGATGAAAELANVILFNPPDSSNLITVTGISVGSNNAERIRIAVDQSVAGAQTNTERFREGRLISPTALPVGQIRTLSNPSQIAEQVDFRVLANESTFLKDENGLAVLSPDTKITVASTVATNTIFVTFWWRERAAQEAELQF